MVDIEKCHKWGFKFTPLLNVNSPQNFQMVDIEKCHKRGFKFAPPLVVNSPQNFKWLTLRSATNEDSNVISLAQKSVEWSMISVLELTMFHHKLIYYSYYSIYYTTVELLFRYWKVKYFTVARLTKKCQFLVSKAVPSQLQNPRCPPTPLTCCL